MHQGFLDVILQMVDTEVCGEDAGQGFCSDNSSIKVLLLQLWLHSRTGLPHSTFS